MPAHSEPTLRDSAVFIAMCRALPADETAPARRASRQSCTCSTQTLRRACSSRLFAGDYASSAGSTANRISGQAYSRHVFPLGQIWAGQFYRHAGGTPAPLKRQAIANHTDPNDKSARNGSRHSTGRASLCPAHSSSTGLPKPRLPTCQGKAIRVWPTSLHVAAPPDPTCLRVPSQLRANRLGFPRLLRRTHRVSLNRLGPIDRPHLHHRSSC